MANPEHEQQRPDALNSSRLDLNLLTVFDVVMTERHVTRAAERLDMTQSAVSNALNRLRNLFQDQLFVKAPRGVQPTPKALALWPRIHDALEGLRETVDPYSFDAQKVAQRFRISMVDLSAALLAPHLYRAVHAESPRSSIFLVPHDPALTAARLMRRELDFAVNVEAPRSAIVQAAPLWTARYALVARRDHPILDKPLTLQEFCAVPQLAVNLSGADDSASAVDNALANLGYARHIALSVNHFSVATSVLRSSDLVAVLPDRFALTLEAREALVVRPVPFTVPDAVMYLSWHQRSNTLPSHQWFKQHLLHAAQALNEQAQLLFPLSA